MRHAATSTTIDHPTPMRSRFEPVMLASASGAYLSGSVPALAANVKSTAYSGSTAMSASTASARPWETSSCMTSAAQARRNAEPRIASPKRMGATTSGSSAPPSRATRPGSVAATDPASARTVARTRVGLSSCGRVTPAMLRGGSGRPHLGYGDLREAGPARPCDFDLRIRGIPAEALTVGTTPRRPLGQPRRHRMTTHHITLQESAPHWRQYARCLGADPDLYPSPEDPADAAKEICYVCPVREPCLEHAITAREKQ